MIQSPRASGGLGVQHATSCHTLLKFEFSRQIVEKYSNITFMKIPPVRAEMFLRDRRTDRHNKAICHFRNFSKASEH